MSLDSGAQGGTAQGYSGKSVVVSLAPGGPEGVELTGWLNATFSISGQAVFGDLALSMALDSAMLHFIMIDDEVSAYHGSAAPTVAGCDSADFMVKCPAGRTTAAVGGQGQCMDCPLDTFKSGVGSAACVGCQPHSSTAFAGNLTGGLGGVSSADCLCNVGYHGSMQCVACAAGKYNPTPGNAGGCMDCDGTTQASAAASTSITACVCVAGTYGAAGGTCLLCPAGKYSDRANMTLSCTDCLANSYNPGKFCLAFLFCPSALPVCLLARASAAA